MNYTTADRSARLLTLTLNFPKDLKRLSIFQRSSSGEKHRSPEPGEKSARKKVQNGGTSRRRNGGLRNDQKIPRDNGLIGTTPEITCDDFDHEHTAGTVARVRFVNEERPR